MSEEHNEESSVTKESEELAKQVSEYLQEAAKRFNAKFPGKVQDIAFILNYAPELRKQPIPKMVVETFRAEDEKFDPVSQTLEISDLMTYGGQQMIRQLLSIVLQQNVMMQQRLAAMADQAIGAGLGRPGPGQAPSPLKLIVPGR